MEDTRAICFLIDKHRLHIHEIVRYRHFTSTKTLIKLPVFRMPNRHNTNKHIQFIIFPVVVFWRVTKN